MERYYYFGSSESYAGGFDFGLINLPTPEEVPHVFPSVDEARWSYGISKSLGEFASMAAHSQYGLEVCILRIHNVFGPRMGDKHVIPDLVRKFSSGSGQVFGLKETRSFLYVDDLVDAFLKLRSLSNLPNVINVGSNEEVSISDLAHLLQSLLEVSVNIEDAGNFSSSVKRRIPDIELLKSIIDFRVSSLRDGLIKYLTSEGLI